MEKLIVSNLDKLVPVVTTVFGKIGNYFGEYINDAIDKVFEKASDTKRTIDSRADF